MNNTPIGWTDKSSNPIYVVDKATGQRMHYCTKTSPGCAHCYSETLSLRWWRGHPYLPANRDKVDWRLKEAELVAWIKYDHAVAAGKKPPVKLFVGDMTDLWHPDNPTALLDQVVTVALLTPHLIKQFLTKRANRLRAYWTDPGLYQRLLAVARTWRARFPHLGDVPLSDPTRSPVPYIWLGVSAENQYWLEKRTPDLLACPAAVHYISGEPLLGALDARPYLEPSLVEETRVRDGVIQRYAKLDWIIVGGESGAKHRPFNLDWARTLRDQCQAAGVAFFFKQGAARLPGRDRLLDGRTWDEVPGQTAVAA